jgi:glycosyltransferase involved in cell wall biosynthesis
MVPARVRWREFLRYRLLARALAILDRIESFIARAPAAASFVAAPRGDAVLLLSHGLGGGVDKQVAADGEALVAAGREAYLFTFQPMRRSFVLRRVNGGDGETFRMPWAAGRLWARLDTLGVGQARLHHLRYWPSYMTVRLAGFFASRGIALGVHLHDFYYLCPRIHLLDGDYRPCGLPDDVSVCNSCIARGGSFVPLVADVAHWREVHLSLLTAAAYIVAPSESCAAIYRRQHPNLRIDVQPHEPAVFPEQQVLGKTAVLTLAIVGNLLRHKGADIVLAAARYARAQRLPLAFTVIGDRVYAPELRALGVTVTGAYAPQDLPALLEAAKADYVWLASPWPETYCFEIGRAHV